MLISTNDNAPKKKIQCHMSWSLLCSMICGKRRLFVFFNGGIVDHHCLNFLFIIQKGNNPDEKSCKSKINRKCYRKCDFQAFDWLKFTLTTDLRLATFCEIDHRSLNILTQYLSFEHMPRCLLKHNLLQIQH